MSFSIRLALSIAVLVACTATMGLAALWTMSRLHERLTDTDERYEDLRGLYEIGSRATTARLLLNAAPRDATEFRRQLVGAMQATDRLLQHVSETPLHERGQMQSSLESMRSGLESSLIAEQQPQSPSASSSALNACLSQVASLSAELNRAIAADRQAVTDAVGTARWTLGSLAGAALVAAIILGLMQHRSVARPLKALRLGVERIASHQLDEPIAETGPREFRELIRQFNHMRGEIHALQDSLNRQVENKSQQLIRSERLAGLGYLAAGLAHEINNPLGVIGGYAETMLRRLEVLEAQKSGPETPALTPTMLHDLGEALRTISDEVFRCQDITSGLLQMTRAGGAEEKHESIDLIALVERIAHMLQRLPLCNDRRLTVESPHAGPLLARGHRAQLTQVLINLITNALEATEAGSGVVRVTIAAQAGSALIRIEDNGCGMSVDTIERVFDPLFTDKARRGLAGIGLGLSISHAIIERHGGRIDASSEGPGRGSAFVLELPAISAIANGVSLPS